MTFPMPDEGATRWMYAYARKNYWRVAPWMDYDDLIQDGYYAWCEVCWRYPEAVKTPQHIMSLFKMCFADKITDLARGRTKQIDDARSDFVEAHESPQNEIPELLSTAPKIVRDAILLHDDPETLAELQKPFQRQPNGQRETLNDRFCRLLNLNSKRTDVVGEVRMYLSTT